MIDHILEADKGNRRSVDLLRTLNNTNPDFHCFGIIMVFKIKKYTMKKQILFGSLVGITLAISACTTEHVVVERPAPAVVVKPNPPAGRTVYVEEYRWRGGKYVMVPGHYVKAKPGRTWVPGHWDQRPKGYVWVPGHWK